MIPAPDCFPRGRTVGVPKGESRKDTGRDEGFGGVLPQLLVSYLSPDPVKSSERMLSMAMKMFMMLRNIPVDPIRAMRLAPCGSQYPAAFWGLRADFTLRREKWE